MTELCSPWIFVAFLAGAVAMLPRLGVHSDLSNFWEIATDRRIWTGVPNEGQEKFTFWHVVFFAWFCNAALHFGLNDMAIFRYARHWSYGLFSAFGMYPGHTLAWICSGIMVAAVQRQMNPGLMAYEAMGLAGLLAVLITGWTTANPYFYRSGLALQCVTPQLAALENNAARRSDYQRCILLSHHLPALAGLRSCVRNGARANGRVRRRGACPIPQTRNRTPRGRERRSVLES